MDTSFSQTQVASEQEDDEYESDGDSALQYDSTNDDELPGFDPEAAEKQPEKEKRQRKPMSSSKLPTGTQMVIAVNTRVVPTQPDKVSSGYNTSMGLIVRQCVRITCMDLKSKNNKILRETLLDKLFTI